MIDLNVLEVIKGLEMIRRREAEELIRLSKYPNLFNAAVLLTDALLRDLDYLCNFDHLVDGRGNNEDVVDVMDRLENDIKATFHRLTGKEYTPPICRQVNFNRRFRDETIT